NMTIIEYALDVAQIEIEMRMRMRTKMGIEIESELDSTGSIHKKDNNPSVLRNANVCWCWHTVGCEKILKHIIYTHQALMTICETLQSMWHHLLKSLNDPLECQKFLFFYFEKNRTNFL